MIVIPYRSATHFHDRPSNRCAAITAVDGISAHGTTGMWQMVDRPPDTHRHPGTAV
ncbi:hypothetical protein DVS28_b0197 (plasmid) [Euzebya pacifica]|uniref:Uncharacterized protein n=1 Tax=Euzebya pacifica TaxID=1608957 RepID=A0A346Y670_9ACTN|nr:hypothetical protein DVS28_b0197 [Euzebya pacifica]